MVRQTHHEWPMSNLSRHSAAIASQSLPLKEEQPNAREGGHPAES